MARVRGGAGQPEAKPREREGSREGVILAQAQGVRELRAAQNRAGGRVRRLKTERAAFMT